MKTKVVDLNNKAAGEITLDDTVFGLEIRKDILSRVVNWQLAKRRAGTHKTKGVSEVSGSGRKPWKQKGTGRARAGNIRQPQARGGGVVFGPVVRKHGFSLPKKVRKLGLKTALSSKQADGKLLIVDKAELKDAKTKELAKRLDKMGLASALFIGGPVLDSGFARALANIPNVDLLPPQGANVYDIMRRDTLILTKEAVEHLEARLK